MIAINRGFGVAEEQARESRSGVTGYRQLPRERMSDMTADRFRFEKMSAISRQGVCACDQIRHEPVLACFGRSDHHCSIESLIDRLA